ncbi:chromosome partitioning protein ParA, partial [Salmonella enterica]|nr:chromosome partitioning protein ParA [Salmonella enterica]
TVLEAQAYSRKVEARFLITRKIEMATMLNVLKESIKDTGVKAFRTAITQRQVYVKSILDGDSVFESSDGAAKGEIEILTKEMIGVFE